MPQPYDYSLNIPSPMDAFSQAFNVGAAGQKARYAREDREAAIARKEAETAAVDGFFAKPIGERTQEDYLRLGMFNPKLAELAQSQWDNMSEERQQVAFRDATQIHTALINTIVGETDPEIVDQIFASRVEATKGDPGLNKIWTDAREIARTDPEAAEAMVGTRIAQLPGGKDYFSTMESRGKEARKAALQPQQLEEQRLKLIKLENEIKWKDFEGFENLAKAGVDIMSLVGADSPIRNELEQISSYQKQLNAARQRQDQATAANLELQIQEKKDSVQEKAQAKVQEQKVQLLASDDLLRKSTEILDAALEKDAGGNYKKDKEGNYIVNATARAALGPVDQFLFTVQPDVADFEEDVGVLAAQIYLDKVKLMRGTGQLSDNEGAKLERAAESLALRQSPQKFITNVMSIRDLSERNAKLTQEKYGDFSVILERRAAGDTEVDERVSTVTTQEEFDQLPSGSKYIGSDGIEYRKQ